ATLRRDQVNMKPINGRPLVSLSIASCLLVLATTSFLLYFLKHSNATAAIHTTFGLAFLLAATLHIRNNFKPLKGYTYKAGERTPVFFKKELFMTFIPAALLLGGLFYEVPGFSALYDWGNEWRAKQENKQESRLVYQHITTNPAGKGVALEVDVKK